MELLQTNNWLFRCNTTLTWKKPFVYILRQCWHEALLKFAAYFNFYMEERERNGVFLSIVDEKRPTHFHQQLLEYNVSPFSQNLSLPHVWNFSFKYTNTNLYLQRSSTLLQKIFSLFLDLKYTHKLVKDKNLPL